MDIEVACQYLRDHAHAKSQGYCAKYVADALEAGGLTFDRQPSAFLYTDILPASGYIKLAPEARASSER